MTTVKFKRFTDTARTPEYAHSGDAGADLFIDSAEDSDHVLWPGRTKRFWTGIGVALPPGHVGLLLPRGSTTMKGVLITNVLDVGYTGQIALILHNVGLSPLPMPRGTKVAQLVIVPCVRATFERVDELDESERGASGFGASGT